MRPRPRRGALGLRGRIVGAVLVTTVATLAVAAVALLGPLESKLRGAELLTLKSQVAANAAASYGFKEVDPSLVLDCTAKPAKPTSQPEQAAAAQVQSVYQKGCQTKTYLFDAAARLGDRISASEIALVGLADASGHGGTPVVVWPDRDLASSDSRDDVPVALVTNKPKYSFGTINGTEYARAAIPFEVTPQGGGKREHWVLAVRKPLDEVTAAVAAVRTAFLEAALAGAALTLILAFPLAGTLVRRLRRLREATVMVAEGSPSVEVPVDRARDEVGDLARTFAIMQRRLEQQEEARRAFVATASHELRTPLASLDGMLELLDDDLQSGDPDLEDARSLLERARAQSRRLGRLAADLLDLSRLDAQTELRCEPVELGELSRAVLAEFELGTAERGIISTLDDRAGPVWALGDPGGVARILRILLDNAVRVSPDGGEVNVELRRGGPASISVRDHGPGVPPSERELIFERFQRGRVASGKAGFGLGLAIGRELAARMGGELVLEDGDAPGAKFTLRLPLTHAPETEPLAVI